MRDALAGAWLHAVPAFCGAEEAVVEAVAAAGGLIVTPSARKSAAIRDLLERAHAGAGAGGQPPAARVVELPALLAEAGGEPVPDAVARTLLVEALRGAPGAGAQAGGGDGDGDGDAGDGPGLGDLRRFPGIAARVGDLIATLKRYGRPDPQALHAALVEVRGGARRLTARDRGLVDAFGAYQKALRGRPDAADVALAAPERLAPPDRVAVVGFHDLDHVQRTAVRSLAARSQRLDLVADHEPAGDATRATAPLVAWARSWMREADAPAGPADEPAGRAERRTAAAALFGAITQAAPCASLELFEAADAQAEVVEIAQALAAMAAGEGPDAWANRRVAVVFPDLARYAPLVREVFPRYRLPYDLAHGAALGDTPVGRTAAALLDFVTEGYTRRGLYDLATAPFIRLRAGGGGEGGEGGDGNAGDPDARPAAAVDLYPGFVDRHAREAGVTGGGGLPEAEWIEPLEARRDALAASADTEPDRAADAQMLDGQIDVLRTIFRRFSALRRPAPPRALAEAITATFEWTGLLGRPGLPVEGAPDDLAREERAAALALVASLSDIAEALDAALSGRPTDLARFAGALRGDFSVRAVRAPGDPGGVRVLGRLEPRSLEFDVLFVGGLSADRFPAADLAGGGVMPERDRAALGLPPAERRREEGRHLLYRVLLAPRERLVLSWPGRDGQARLLPADLVADLARLTGAPVRRPAPGPMGPIARLWTDLGRALAAPLPEDSDEAARRVEDLAPPPDLLAAGAALARGVAVDAARRTPGPPGRWSGLVGDDPDAVAALALRLTGPEHAFSPSQLDRYALCPFAYLAEDVLRLGRPEDEDDEDALPAAWGELVHRILARWALARGASGPDASLPEIARRELAAPPWRDYTGPFWDAARAELFERLLPRFQAAEAEAGRAPLHAEWRFGGPAAEIEDPASVDEPLVLRRADAPEVRVVGRVDRLDGDGAIYDYKTGRPPALSEAEEGRSLQLPIYVLAARALLDLPAGKATFYRLGGAGGFGPVRGGWPGAPEALAEAEDRILDVVADLRAGRFPLIPWGAERCPPRCRFSRMCRVAP